MKVLLLGDMSGTRDGQNWPPRGSVVELPDDEAAALCDRQMARPAVEQPGEDQAVMPPAEERVLTTRNGPARRKPADADA